MRGRLKGLWAQVRSMAFGGPALGSKTQAAIGTGLLDLYPGAKLAYSTGRRLRDSYTGALFRVRRSSDNAEQDIGFDPETGIVDVSALTTFVGANDGFVTTEYNQALAGGFHATIGTASLQPAIVLAGVVQTLGTNALPAPLWDGTAGVIGDDRLSAANVTFGTLPQLSMWWAARKDTSALYRAICHIGTANVGTGEMAVYSPDVDQGGDTITFYNNTTSASIAVTGAVPFTYVGRIRGNLLSGSTLRAIRANKGAESSSTTTSNSSGYGTKNFHIGNRSDNLAGFMGLIGEVILYQSLTPALTDAIDDDIMAFWGIS